jgi:hypothetical protein
VHSGGILEGRIVLERATHLPRAASFKGLGPGTELVFHDYRDFEGFRFPQRIEIHAGTIPQGLETRSVERLDEEPDALAPRQVARPADARFDPQVPAGIEVRRAPTGHLLVQPRVNGKEHGWFIFDSGAGINCIANDVLDESFEGPIGDITASGIGGLVQTGLWRADALTLGPLTIEDPIFMALDLAFLEVPFGVPIGGIIGYEFLARCTVELDMTEGSIAIFDPGAYELPAGGAWQDAVLYGKRPHVRASFEGREGVFVIDTGAAGDTVTLYYQVVDELDLVESRPTEASTAGGVGGLLATRTGVLESFVLGGHTFKDVTAEFTVEDKGAFSDGYVQGNIGGKLLEPFQLVLDYPNGRLGFLPRE